MTSRGIRSVAAGSALACALLFRPDAALGQEGDGGGAAGATFESSLRVTSLRGGANALAGGALLLGVDERFLFGGGAWVLLGKSVLPGATRASDLELRVSYGGVIAEARLAQTTRGSLLLRALVGAGTGRVALPVVGTVIAADNFGVIEPELLVSRPLRGGLRVVTGAGYRFVFGLEDLPGVSTGDLRGFAIRIGLSVRKF